MTVEAGPGDPTSAVPNGQDVAVPVVLPERLLPWEVHPALTEDRLRACALLLAHARRMSCGWRRWR